LSKKSKLYYWINLAVLRLGSINLLLGLKLFLFIFRHQ